MFAPVHMGLIGGAAERPFPERAAVGGFHAGGDTVAQTSGKGRKPAQTRGEHGFNLGLDAAAQNGGRALGPDGNDDRIAIHDGRCDRVAHVGTVDHVHHGTGGARHACDAVFLGLIACGNEHKTRADKGAGRRNRLVMRTARGDDPLHLGVQIAGGNGDIGLGFQDQA